MQIIQEYLDTESFIEVVLTKDDVNRIDNGRIIAQRVQIEEETINIGVRLVQPGE